MPVAQNLSSRGREIRSRFTADPEKRFFIIRPPDFPSLDGRRVNHERDSEITENKRSALTSKNTLRRKHQLLSVRT